MNSNIDFIIIGSGIAGLNYALEVSKYGKTIIITKNKATDSNTNLAQGGIASAIDSHDSLKYHIDDTIKSGAGICKKSIVNKVIKSGPREINKLIQKGVDFSTKEKSYQLDLGKEGGHSKNRIVHSKDMTGQEIEKILLKKINENKNIFLMEEHIAIDLITLPSINNNKKKCYGVYVFDKNQKKIKTFLSKITILATGGASKIYLYTSNPKIATGDGIAMAYRAGALISNLEFVQFHPTCLYKPSAKNFLISEAVRGEGGLLLNSDKQRFMKKYNKLGELACRDIVARAINEEIKKYEKDYVYLDISHKNKNFIIKRFPNLYDKCLHFGIDITKEPIPVVPAAHYMCGGILTNFNSETSIQSLYAIGEVACTGLHGANRLASNSLLEALVFANSAAKESIYKIKKYIRIQKRKKIDWINFNEKKSKKINDIINNIRKIMWEYVGIIRSNNSLLIAQKKILKIKENIKKKYYNHNINPEIIELRNIALLSELVIKSAILRKESRGLHFNLDYLDKNDANHKNDTIIKKK